jgi:hypothetical protein
MSLLAYAFRPRHVLDSPCAGCGRALRLHRDKARRWIGCDGARRDPVIGVDQVTRRERLRGLLQTIAVRRRPIPWGVDVDFDVRNRR